MPGVFSRALGLHDTNYRDIPDSFSDEAFRGEYTGNNLIYKAFARPGASEDDPVWQIAFLTYDGAGNVLSIQWPLIKQDIYNPGATAADDTAAASNDYFFIWTLRANYTYV